MAVDIKKKVTVTVDGDDVQVLRNVCECARQNTYNYRKRTDLPWTQEELRKIDGLITTIFEDT
jgi:hypothetical protein